jgi:4-amino-4-deoxy-L-arabinose transferase-like glycosyltransferase
LSENKQSAISGQQSAISNQRLALVFILIGYFVVGTLFAVRTPPWQAPDEPAHYNYIAQVANNGCCPVIEPGDWNQAYLRQLTTNHFAPDSLANLVTIQYEDHQPPLYYLIQAVVYRLTGGSLLELRLVSLVIGAGVVVSAYAVGRVLVPKRPQIALGAALFVAFLPQHIAMLAAVDNDSLAELIIGVTVWATLVYLRLPDSPDDVGARHALPLQKRFTPTPAMLGLLVGLGLLTKVSTLFLLGLVPLAIFLRWWTTRRTTGLRGLIMPLVTFAIPALILGGLWAARNVGVYGFPDVFGLRQHNMVVADQPRTADHLADIGWPAYLREAAQTTFDSFWGQFGWMALPMPGWVYTAIIALMLAVLIGLAVHVFILRHPDDPPFSARVIIVLLGLLAALQYVYYNTEFLQFQGRYLYAGLIAFGLWVALGLDAWDRWLFQRGPAGSSSGGLRAYLGLLPLALFIVLDVYLIWRVIPQLGP